MSSESLDSLLDDDKDVEDITPSAHFNLKQVTYGYVCVVCFLSVLQLILLCDVAFSMRKNDAILL